MAGGKCIPDSGLVGKNLVSGSAKRIWMKQKYLSRKSSGLKPADFRRKEICVNLRKKISANLREQTSYICIIFLIKPKN